jgi:hypothetical protein
MDPAHRSLGAAGRVDDPRARCFWQVGSNRQGAAPAFFDFMRAQHFERVFMIAMNDRANGVERNLRLHGEFSLEPRQRWFPIPWGRLFTRVYCVQLSGPRKRGAQNRLDWR